MFIAYAKATQYCSYDCKLSVARDKMHIKHNCFQPYNRQCSKCDQIFLVRPSEQGKKGRLQSCDICRNLAKTASHKKYYEKNKERSKEYTISWGKRNRKQILEKRAEDPIHKIRVNIWKSFKRIGQDKPANTEELLGCPWEEAKQHFESLFQEGMSWDNMGKWHIDHIRPVNTFKGRSFEELKEMNHISNLRPLWAEDNVRRPKDGND